MIALAIALAVLVVVLAVALYRATRPPKSLQPRKNARRILVPFTGGQLDQTALEASIRIAHAEEAVLVPAYLLVVPLQYAEESPLQKDVAVALPLLEAVEHAALRAGVPVDARIEKGRTPVHALERLWDVERFDRVVAPASSFTPKELTWILTHSPTETVVLQTQPSGAAERGDRGLAEADAAVIRRDEPVREDPEAEHLEASTGRGE